MAFAALPATVAWERSDSVPFFAAAAVALGVWLLVAAVILVRSRPRLPDPAPATTDLRPESPAVVNLLVNRCSVTATAMPATLLDLAARRYLDIDQIDTDTYLCRLFEQRPTNGTLLPYEAKMLDLVRDRAAADGTVACAELSLGTGAASGTWWSSFSAAVLADARSRGLVRSRWNNGEKAFLVLTYLVPTLLAASGLAIVEAANRQRDLATASTSSNDPSGSFLTVVVVALVALMVAGKRLSSWRETSTGRTAAAHWLGFRNGIRDNESLATAPPPAVAIWGRNLAFGVATGVCAETAQRLPIGPQRDDEAWSAYGGLWREVHISYPKRFAEGVAPPKAFAVGLGWTLLSLALLAVTVKAFGPIVGGVTDAMRDSATPINVWVRFGVGGAIALLLALPIIWSSMRLVRGVGILRRAVPDLGKRLTIEGQIVRIPQHWVDQSDGHGYWAPSGYTAIDDGHSHDVSAYRFHRSELRERDVVRLTVSPHLRHVYDCVVIGHSGRSTSGPTV